MARGSIAESARRGIHACGHMRAAAAHPIIGRVGPLATGHRRVLLGWGAVMGTLVAAAVVVWPEPRPDNVTRAAWIAWLAAFAAFFVLFWFSTAQPSRTRARRIALLGCETATVLAIMSLRPALGLEGALFVPIAFQLGRERRAAPSVVWITLQSAAMFGIMSERFGLDHAFSLFAAYLPFQLLAFFTSSLLAREERAREELGRLNAELLATREVLAESSRTAERLRISRELHDVFGHRLAALSLNLEIATRIDAADKPRFIDKAHGITRSLLGEVREVAANLRQDVPCDLPEAVRRMVRDVPRPVVHLDCPDGLRANDDGAAEVLLRCAQETVTNAMKHSNADNLWIRLDQGDAGIELRVSDDGDGTGDLQAGSGLRGMRERVAELGGSVEVESAPRAGFRVRVFVPTGS